MATIKALNVLKNKYNYFQSINNPLFINNYENSNFPQIICRFKKKRGFQKVLIRSTPEVVPRDPVIEGLRKSNREPIIPNDLSELRFAFPEFLPSPVVEHRNKVCDQLMRTDMIRRRQVIDIPEFYVGSILAVSISDPYATGKLSKFVGICIERKGYGTYANFTLRNRVESQGVEIRYDLYNPTIREIQVIKLEKRLDSELLYLRDALPEFSVFPFDMTPEPHSPDEPVPVNPLQVVMKPWPWTMKWHYRDYKGIKQYPNMPDYVFLRKWKVFNEYEKYDLMKEYRDHIPEDDQLDIWTDVNKHRVEAIEARELERRKKLLSQTVKQTKT